MGTEIVWMAVMKMIVVKFMVLQYVNRGVGAGATRAAMAAPFSAHSSKKEKKIVGLSDCLAHLLRAQATGINPFVLAGVQLHTCAIALSFM